MPRLVRWRAVIWAAASAVAVGVSGLVASPPHSLQSVPSTSSPCAPGTGERPWLDISRSPECRAQLALAAMTPEERVAFRGTNERLGLVSPPGTDGPNGVIGGGFGIEQT